MMTAHNERCLVCDAAITRPDACGNCGISFGSSQYRAIRQADAAILQCDDRWRELWERREQWVEHRRLVVDQARASLEPRPTPADGPADAQVASASAPGFAAAPAARAPRPADVRRAPVPPRVASSAPPARTSRLTAPVMLGVGGAALLIASAIVFIAVTWATLLPALQALVVGALAAGIGGLAVWLDRRGLRDSAGAVGVVSMAFAGVAVVALDRDFAVLGAFGGAVVLVLAAGVGQGLHRLGVGWVSLTGTLALLAAGVWASAGAAVDLGAIGGSSILTFTLAATVAGAGIAGVSAVWTDGAESTVLRVGAVVLVTAGGLATLVSLVESPDGWAVLGAGALPVIALAALATRWRLLAVAPLPLVVPLWSAAVALAFWDGDAGAAVLAAAAAWVVVLAVGRAASPRQQRYLVVASAPVSLWFAIAALVAAGQTVAWTLASVTSALHGDVPGDWLAAPGVLAGAALVIAGLGTVLWRGWRLPRGWVSAPQTGGAVLVLAGVTALASSVQGDATAILALHVAGASAVAAACRVWSVPAARWTAGIGALAIGLGAGALGALVGAQGDVRGLAVGALAVVAMLVGARWQPRVTVAPALLLATVLTGATGWWLAGTWTAVIGLAAAMSAASLAALRWRLPAWAPVAAIGAVPAVAVAAVVVAAGVASAAIALFTGGEAGGATWWTLAAAALVAGSAVLARDLGSVARREVAVLDVVAGLAVVAIPALLLGATVTTLPATSGGRESLAQALSAAVAVGLCVLASMRGSGLGFLTVRVGAMAWLTVVTFVTAGRLADLESPATPGVFVLGALVLVHVGLAVRWPRLAAGSAAFAATIAPGAIAACLGATFIDAAAVTAVAVAATAWAATHVPRQLRNRLFVGAAPAGAAVATGVVIVLARVVEAWVELLDGRDPSVLTWGPALLAVAAAAAALSFGWARRHLLAELAGGVALILAACIPQPATWVVPAALGAALAIVGMTRVRRLPGVGIAVMVAAIPWSGGDAWTAGLTVLLAAAALTWVAAASPRRWPLVELVAGAALGAAGAGLLLEPLGSPEASLLVAFAVGAAATLAPWLARRDAGRTARLSLLSALTAVLALASPSLWGAGLILLLAAAAWWGLRMQGLRRAWWASAGTGSAAIALLLASAQVGAIELYVAAPAATALVVGVRALRRDAQLPSVRALAPGLAIALVPSLIALAADPSSLSRTLGLAAAVALLAAAGARLRWLAPIGAAATTAVALALTQATASEAVVSRWIAFAVVGVILIALAATYEKIRGMR